MGMTRWSTLLTRWQVGLILVLTVALMTACAGVEASTAPEPAGDGGERVESGTALDTSYEDALPVSIQLALGTMRLEETDDAVTPEQAVGLLPLWRAIEGGTLKGDEETNAVLRQIEGKMTSEQLAAIAAMQLTQESMRAWAQSQGLRIGVPPEGQATDGGKSTAEGARTGPMGAGGQRPNLSPEQIEAMRATVEAGGGPAADRSGAGGVGQIGFVADPLMRLLTQRAGE